MTPQQSLKYHLALFLAAYGDKAVLAALAEILKIPQHELEKNVIELHDLQPRIRGRPARVKRDVTELLATQKPEKAEALRALSERYRNKTFLAELSDVRRFFEQHSRPFGQTKSRLEALPKLVRLLADLDFAELNDLCKSPSSKEYSSLGVISDQILGRNEK